MTQFFTPKVKKRVTWGVIALVIGVGGITVVNANFKATRLENTLSGQFKNNMAELSNCLRKIDGLAEIADAQSATFANAMVDVIKGRYQGTKADPSTPGVGQGGAWFSALTENYPDLKGVTAAYGPLATELVSCQNRYTDFQKALRDAFVAYDNYRNGSWSGLLTFGRLPSNNLTANITKTNIQHGQDAYDTMTSLVTTKAATGAYETGEMPASDLNLNNGGGKSPAPNTSTK